jgi:hypothetical protein
MPMQINSLTQLQQPASLQSATPTQGEAEQLEVNTPESIATNEESVNAIPALRAESADPAFTVTTETSGFTNPQIKPEELDGTDQEMFETLRQELAVQQEAKEVAPPLIEQALAEIELPEDTSNLAASQAGQAVLQQNLNELQQFEISETDATEQPTGVSLQSGQSVPAVIEEQPTPVQFELSEEQDGQPQSVRGTDTPAVIEQQPKPIQFEMKEESSESTPAPALEGSTLPPPAPTTLEDMSPLPKTIADLDSGAREMLANFQQGVPAFGDE